MATSEEILQDETRKNLVTPQDYKKAVLACLAEIEETVERIHRSLEERAHIKNDSDKLIAQLIEDTEKRIKHRQIEIARTNAEIAELRAKLDAA